MATENRAEFVLSLDGDDSAIRGIFNAFRKTVKDSAADLEQTTSNIVLFKGLKENLDKTSAAVTSATDNLAKLREQVKATQDAGGEIGKDLAKNLRDAERAAASANKEFAKQETAVARMGKTLTSAGVDTKNLAVEQIRLAEATKVAAAAEADQAAKQALGLKTLRDVAPEIQKLNAAYNTLRSSGTLSVKELALAQQQLVAKTNELRASVTGAGAAARTGGADLKQFFTGSLLPALGLAGGIATLASGFKAALEASREFSTGIAKIGTITNATKDELGALGTDVRTLARELGLDLNEALKATFELLRSGVPKENVVEVLRLSAEAAIANMTSLATAAKASSVLLDAFGLDVSQLGAALDVVTNSAHNGGPTLNEFADNAAALGNAAQATGQDFNTVSALLQVMTDKSNDAAGSAALLAKILINVAKPETIAKLRALGIETTNVAEILQQIGEKTGGNVNAFLELGVASGKSGAALSALTNNAKDVVPALEAAGKAAGTVAKNVAELYSTPEERTKRFNAELHETATALGESFGSGSKLAAFGTTLLKFFNDATRAEKDLKAATIEWLKSLDGAPPAAEAAAKSTSALAAAQALAGQEAKKIAAAVNAANDALRAFTAALAADLTALQAAAAKDIAGANQRADAQIAALDRSRAAEAATAAATLAIKLKLGQDTLEILLKNEAAITAATNVAIAAREKLAKAAGDSDKKIAADSAQARINSLGPVLAAYQALYTQLIALAQNELAKVQTFQQARIGVAQQVEDALRNIRLEALTGLDQYVAKMAEIDRLVSEGRKAAAQGDAEAAKQFFQQAIQASQGLSTVVAEDGRVVVTTTQATADKVAFLTKIQKAANESFGDQEAAAKKGADGAIAQANRIRDEAIAPLQAQLDALKATAAEGLDLKVETDEASIAKTIATLDDLTKPRTVTITVNTVDGSGNPAPNPGVGDASQGFARGGPVRRFRLGGHVRGFARGGAVFRTPGWMKVPGQGSGDTVPAALQAGSFVVRKAASRHYGDGIMSRLARGYAVGGTVTKDEIRRYAEGTFGFDPFASPGKGGPGDRQAQTPRGQTGAPGQPDASVQPTDPPISFDSRSIPDELITAANVIQYAREMLNMVGQTNPLLGVLLPDILDGIRSVQARPNDKRSLFDLLKAAETIGANPYLFDMWGKTTSAKGSFTPEWFIDWLTERGMIDAAGNVSSQSSTSGGSVSSAAKRILESAFGLAGVPPIAQRILTGGNSRFRNPLTGFALGGAAGDSVAAMLTPGEFVIRKPAAQRYGGRFLDAVNRMAIPRGLLANMMAPPVARFAAGGPVISGGVSSPSAASGPQSGISSRTTNITIQAAAGDLLSEANVRRFIVPVLRDVERGSR